MTVWDEYLRLNEPAIEQQQRISDILLSMDNKIAALEAKRSKYEMVRQGMTRRLLTGASRLT